MTDEDLKMLKNFAETKRYSAEPGQIIVWDKDIPALIARLEAAEALAPYAMHPDNCDFVTKQKTPCSCELWQREREWQASKK